jgi:hypothetical protein
MKIIAEDRQKGKDPTIDLFEKKDPYLVALR